ncbi:MAG: hypothetical protein ACREHG_01275 [Candidatus Saccharimonadales bacterium]
MTDIEDSRDPHSISVEIIVADDRHSAELRFKSEGKIMWVATADTTSLEGLLHNLGNTRSRLLEPVSIDLPPGVLPLDEYDPRWFVLPDTTNRFATFWVRHPGFGWSGYGFPRHEAGNIAKWLRKITTVTSTRETQSPLATSFGGDSFLITTEGLGFYYYGKGEKQIGPNPFEQIEFDSDRAAGIVAGSIAERRLEQALRSRMRTDVPTTAGKLFRPSGALGSFSVKIDLASLLGILSDDAYKDLTNLKNIRNDFAHELELDSFDVPSVRDRCKNFVLVDRHVGPVPAKSIIEDVADRADPYLGLRDYQRKLCDARFRYVMTAQIISYLLGQRSETSDGRLPMI